MFLNHGNGSPGNALSGFFCTVSYFHHLPQGPWVPACPVPMSARGGPHRASVGSCLLPQRLTLRQGVKSSWCLGGPSEATCISHSLDSSMLGAKWLPACENPSGAPEARQRPGPARSEQRPGFGLPSSPALSKRKLDVSGKQCPLPRKV